MRQRIRDFIDKHMGREELLSYLDTFSIPEIRTTMQQDIQQYEFAHKLGETIKSVDLSELRPLLPQTKKDIYWIPSKLREAYIPFMGFSFINLEYVDNLANFLKGKKVLEVMAGNGLLSLLLEERGVDIIATDIAPGENNHYDIRNVYNDKIETLDAVEAIRKYGRSVDYVIMSWPPYDNPIATKVMRAIKEVNNDIRVIYIGEQEGGCTADYKFFDIIEWVEDEDFLPVQQSYTRWRFIGDSPSIVKNK